jgi:hypothetical protein
MLWIFVLGTARTTLFALLGESLPRWLHPTLLPHAHHSSTTENYNGDREDKCLCIVGTEGTLSLEFQAQLTRDIFAAGLRNLLIYMAGLAHPLLSPAETGGEAYRRSISRIT